MQESPFLGYPGKHVRICRIGYINCNLYQRRGPLFQVADSYIQMRNKLLKDGKLVESKDKKYWVFSQNTPFSSTSTAAAIVGGAQLNGRTNWKLEETGETYAHWQESQTE